MARFDGGWIRIERKLLGGDIAQNGLCLSLWVWLLCSAAVFESKIRWKNEARTLKPGDVWFSLADLAGQWGISKSTLHKHLRYLADSERLKYESGTQGCIVSILNWSKYQEDWKGARTSNELGPNEDRTGDERGENEEETAHERGAKHIEQYNKVQSTINNKQENPFPGTLRVASEPNGNHEPSSKNAPHPKPPAKTAEVWSAYAKAYRQRYGADPVRNATVNSQASQLLARLGAEEAPLVVEFYVSHNNRWYVQNMHSLGICLKDAEKLRTEWATGRSITQEQAKTVEKASNYASMLQRIDQGVL
jgi:hypothetical protein